MLVLCLAAITIRIFQPLVCGDLPCCFLLLRHQPVVLNVRCMARSNLSIIVLMSSFSATPSLEMTSSIHCSRLFRKRDCLIAVSGISSFSDRLCSDNQIPDELQILNDQFESHVHPCLIQREKPNYSCKSTTCPVLGMCPCLVNSLYDS